MGDKGLGLKINKWNWVHGLGERAGLRLLPGSAEWSPWMRHFPIEVIKMIEDSGKLVHLTARWRGTRRMCRRPKGESASALFFFSSFFYVLYRWCVPWRVSVSTHALERVAKWDWQRTVAQRRPQESHVFSTAHPAKNIYHHTQSNLHFNLTFIKSESWDRKKIEKTPAFSNFSPVILSLCWNPFLFIYFWVGFILRRRCGEQWYQPSKVVLQDPVGVIKLDFNQSGCSVQQIVSNYLSEGMAGRVPAAGER